MLLQIQQLDFNGRKSASQRYISLLNRLSKTVLCKVTLTIALLPPPPPPQTQPTQIPHSKIGTATHAVFQSGVIRIYVHTLHHVHHVHTVGSHDDFIITSIIVCLCCHPAAARSNSDADFEFPVWTPRAVAIRPRLCFVATSTANCQVSSPSIQHIKTVKFKFIV